MRSPVWVASNAVAEAISLMTACGDLLGPAPHPSGKLTIVINISVSSRSLAAARSVDPDVSAAAVRAAVEVAIAEQMRELRRSRDATRLDPTPYDG
jgi:hypothetical protein